MTNENTCKDCTHCTHVETDELGENYYFCELDGNYIHESFALDTRLDCEGYVKNMDDDHKA